MGTSSQVKLADGYTYGLSSDGKAINFQNSLWTSTGVSTTCAHQRWAKNYNVVWDGVTNFNGCK